MKSEKCGLMYDHSYTGDKPLEEGYHTDESQEVLFDKILFAFESHQDDFAHQEKLYGKTLSTKDNEWEEYNQKVKEGMTLFAEYYGGLWT